MISIICPCAQIHSFSRSDDFPAEQGGVCFYMKNCHPFCSVRSYIKPFTSTKHVNIKQAVGITYLQKAPLLPCKTRRATVWEHSLAFPTHEHATTSQTSTCYFCFSFQQTTRELLKPSQDDSSMKQV